MSRARLFTLKGTGAKEKEQSELCKNTAPQAPPEKVDSEPIGVKTARLQAVSRCERDFFGRGGTVKRVTDFLCNKKSEQAKLVPTWRRHPDLNWG